MKRLKRRSTPRRTRSRPNTPDPTSIVATSEPSTPPPASEAEEEEEATPVAPRRSARASKRRTRSSPASALDASLTSTRKQSREAFSRSSDEDGDETESELKEEDDKSGDDDDETEETTPVPNTTKHVRRRGRRAFNDTEQSTNEVEGSTAKKAPARKRRRATRSATPAVSSADDTATNADMDDAAHTEEENDEGAALAAAGDNGDTGEPDSTDDTMPKKPQHIAVKRIKRKKSSKDDDEGEATESEQDSAPKSEDDLSDHKSESEEVETMSDEGEAVTNIKQSETKAEADDRESPQIREPGVVTNDAKADTDSIKDASTVEDSTKGSDEAKSKSSGPDGTADKGEDEHSEKKRADEEEKVKSSDKPIPPQHKLLSSTPTIKVEKEGDSTAPAPANVTTGASIVNQTVMPDKEVLEAPKANDGIKLEGKVKEEGADDRVPNAITLPDAHEPSKESDPAPNAAPKMEPATEVVTTSKEKVFGADTIDTLTSSEEKDGDSPSQKDGSTMAQIGEETGCDLVVEEPTRTVEAASMVENEVMLEMPSQIASSDDLESAKEEMDGGPCVEKKQKDEVSATIAGETQAPLEDEKGEADQKGMLEPMDVDDPVKVADPVTVADISTPWEQIAEDAVTGGNKKAVSQGKAVDETQLAGDEAKKLAVGVSKETIANDQMSIHLTEMETLPKDGPPTTAKSDGQGDSSTHDLNGTTRGLISDDNIDEKEEKVDSAQLHKTLKDRQEEGGKGTEVSIVVEGKSILPDKATSVLPSPNGLMHSLEQKANQVLQKVEQIPQLTPRLVTSYSNAAIDVVPTQNAGTRDHHRSIDVVQNRAPREKVVRIRFVTEPEATIEEIKIRIYTAGVRAHRGKSAEKMFSNYWNALCRCCGVSLNGGGSDRRSRVMNGTREVIKDFLTTKKLRRLHNSLILGLLHRCVDDTAPADKIAEHIPDHWRKDINVIEKETEPLGDKIGRRDDDNFELNIKSDFECHSGLWTATGVPEFYSTVQEDEDLSICLDKIARSEDNSPALPGALLVDPFVRSIAQREGLKVAENAVWLVMVGMREYVKSLLKNTIASTKAINEGHELPDASVLVRSIGPVAKERSATFEGTKHTAAPPKSGKRKCLSTLDLAAYLMASPLTCGRGNNGLVSEQCYINAFDPLLVTSQSGFESLQEYIASGIETSYSKKHKTEKDPNFLPPEVKATQAQQQTQQPLPLVAAQQIQPSPSVAISIPQPNADESSAEDGLSSKPPNANNLRNPNILRRSPNVKGMGRGAKNLAALKARAAAAASAAKNEDTKSASSSAAQSSDVKMNSGQPPTQSLAQSHVNPITPKSVEIQISSVANVETNKAREGTLQTKPEHQIQQFLTQATAAKTGMPARYVKPAPSEEEPADASTGNVDSNASDAQAATPELPTFSAAAASVPMGARRGGRGFGVKNLAMMRARSVVEEPDDATTTESGNPTETPAEDIEELQPTVDPAKEMEASILAVVPEPAVQEGNPAIDIGMVEELNALSGTPMLDAKKAKPVTGPGTIVAHADPSGEVSAAVEGGRADAHLTKVKEVDINIAEGERNITELLAPVTQEVKPAVDPDKVKGSSFAEASVPTAGEQESPTDSSKAEMTNNPTDSHIPIAEWAKDVTISSESTEVNDLPEVIDPGKATEGSDASDSAAPTAEGGKPGIDHGNVEDGNISIEEAKLDVDSNEGEEGSNLTGVLTSGANEANPKAVEEDNISNKLPMPATEEATPASDLKAREEDSDPAEGTAAEEAKSDPKPMEEDSTFAKAPVTEDVKPDLDPEASTRNGASAKVPGGEEVKLNSAKEDDGDSAKALAAEEIKPDLDPKAKLENSDSAKVPAPVAGEVKCSPKANEQDSDSAKVPAAKALAAEKKKPNLDPEARPEKSDSAKVPAPATGEAKSDSKATEQDSDSSKVPATEKAEFNLEPKATEEYSDSIKALAAKEAKSDPKPLEKDGTFTKVPTAEGIKPDLDPEGTAENSDLAKAPAVEANYDPKAAEEDSDSSKVPAREDVRIDSELKASEEGSDSVKALATEEVKPDLDPEAPVDNSDSAKAPAAGETKSDPKATDQDSDSFKVPAVEEAKLDLAMEEDSDSSEVPAAAEAKLGSYPNVSEEGSVSPKAPEPDVSPGKMPEGGIEGKDAAREAKLGAANAKEITSKLPDGTTLKRDGEPENATEDSNEAKDGQGKAREDTTSEEKDESRHRKEVLEKYDSDSDAHLQRTSAAPEIESNGDKPVVEVGVRDKAIGEAVTADDSNIPKETEKGQESKDSSTGEEEAKA